MYCTRRNNAVLAQAWKYLNIVKLCKPRGSTKEYEVSLGILIAYATRIFRVPVWLSLSCPFLYLHQLWTFSTTRFQDALYSSANINLFVGEQLGEHERLSSSGSCVRKILPCFESPCYFCWWLITVATSSRSRYCFPVGWLVVFLGIRKGGMLQYRVFSSD